MIGTRCFKFRTQALLGPIGFTNSDKEAKVLDPLRFFTSLTEQHLTLCRWFLGLKLLSLGMYLCRYHKIFPVGMFNPESSLPSK